MIYIYIYILWIIPFKWWLHEKFPPLIPCFQRYRSAAERCPGLGHRLRVAAQEISQDAEAFHGHLVYNNGIYNGIYIVVCIYSGI